jgi:hypothetical protein
MPRRKNDQPVGMTPDQKATYDRQCQACAAWIAKLRREIEEEDAKEKAK